jgi:hypothetical protein
MATNQLDLIMNWVQKLPANEQLQLIKRVADLLERAGHSDTLLVLVEPSDAPPFIL